MTDGPIFLQGEVCLTALAGPILDAKPCFFAKPLSHWAQASHQRKGRNGTRDDAIGMDPVWDLLQRAVKHTSSFYPESVLYTQSGGLRASLRKLRKAEHGNGSEYASRVHEGRDVQTQR